MGRFVNPDNSAFQVALNSEIYVDKTGLLGYTNSVLNTKQALICNSRPRRFGKSVTADMLTAYYSKGCNSERMFSDLAISRNSGFKEHLNKYDLIHLDVQWRIEPAGCPNNVVSYIKKTVIEELREAYPGIVPEEYINFLRGLFKGTEPTKFICLAYLTGILPIKKLKTQSALNNFTQYTMLSPGVLAPYIGFTEQEVAELCGQYGREYEKVKCWYDGYCLGKFHVYNPNAVICLMMEGDYQSYWSDTGTYEAIRPLINMDFDGLKAEILTMLAGDSVKVRTKSFQNDMVTFRSKDDVLTLLIHLGYLAYDQKSQTAYVPNEEIRREFAGAVEENKWNEFIEFQRESQDLLEATLDMDEEAVAEGIERIHMEYASVIQYHNENSLSSVLTIAYMSAMQYYFKPARELPTGRGFADFVFIPKVEYSEEYPALLVELKWNKEVKAAIQQMKEKKYPTVLEHYTGNILFVGISYDKKSKEHRCRIEEYRLERP